MREIKFRLFNKNKNRMINWEDIPSIYGIKVLSDNEDVHSYSPWMQYTGLKDKNGKEIYEGDIVRVHEGENFSWEEKVEYFNGCFTVGDDALGAVNTFSEVIGNIYENSDLL